MKKLFSFILTGTILAFSCMICYGGTATLNKENEETSFDIYATYEPGENDYFSARVEADGTWRNRTAERHPHFGAGRHAGKSDPHRLPHPRTG